jgi:hypothetical protein
LEPKTVFGFLATIPLNWDDIRIIGKHEATLGAYKFYQEGVRVTKSNCSQLSRRQLGIEQNLVRFNYTSHQTFIGLKWFDYILAWILHTVIHVNLI